VDARLPVISFTGSGPIGWSIRDAVPRKHVTLELGGNAAAVVCDDWSGDEDLDWAAQRVATFANYQAGQSCISVQRVYADDSIYDRFVGKLAEQIRGLCQGDPRDKETVVGPLINEAAAARVEKWVDEARTEGAQVLVGGRREGTSYAPTLLVDVPQDALVLREEVFGPIVSVIRVDGTDAALAAVNDSPYGLQAGVFTHDMSTAFRAHRDLEVGGVIIGDVPSYRADQMPYGGVKMSGMGREGVRSAMEDLSTDRVLVLSGLDL
jgi:acyl-CoA reductase-like NAD-dependent aldehyde dehydrogenase